MTDSEFIGEVLIALAMLGLFIWAFIDALRNSKLSNTKRLVWLFVITFIICLGPILYLMEGRKN